MALTDVSQDRSHRRSRASGTAEFEPSVPGPPQPGPPQTGPNADGLYALPELRTLEGVRVEPTSLAEKAYYLLRDRIIATDLVPGATLDERGLMADLGLGRTPIREALRRLAGERLVDVVPRRGMYVARLELGDLAAISEVRIELEGATARLAAERATDAERAEIGHLLALVADHDDAAQTTLMRVDQLVHRHVHRAARNAYLAATVEEYFMLSLRLWFFVLDRVHGLPRAVAEHADLLEAVRDGDARRAESIVRAHVAGFERTVRSVI